MKIRLVSLVLAFAVIIVVVPDSVVVAEQSAQPEFAWVLVEINDYENADKWAANDAHDSYSVAHGYSRGVYSASTTYEGDDPYGQGRGGTLAVKAVFSGVPDIIYPDKPVSLKLSFVPTEDSVVALSLSASASANFDQWDIKPGGVTGSAIPFVNDDGESGFKIIGMSSESYDETLTATLGSGYEDSRIALRLGFYMGVSMGTNYVYEWKQTAGYVAHQGSLTADPESSLFPTGRYRGPIEGNGEFWTRWSEQAKSWTPEEIEEAQRAPSTVKIGDLQGETWILRGWEEDQDQFTDVELDTPLYHGDLIVTRRRSGAILSFSDMSTYVMKEDSVIVLDIKNENQSKLALVAGTVWVNLKKMMEDGSLEIEMSQAIAGAKGTTFVCEEVDGSSVLKVLEGSVEYVSKVSSESVLVGGEQMVVADNAGLGDPLSFDMNAELETWDDATQQLTAKALSESKGGPNVGATLALLSIVVLAAVTITVLVRRRRPASLL